MKGPTDPFDDGERAVLDALRCPADIQAYIDATPYSEDPFYRSPRSVMRDRRAHCVDGGLFGAAALHRLGYAPRLVDLRATRDDDHIVAIFEVDGHFGAVAKSNVVGLRYREPIFRTIRELAMSYFEFYYNLDGEKTLRAYSVPLDLSRYDAVQWRTDDTRIEATIVADLDTIRHTPVLSDAMIARLAPMDERTYAAGLQGANPKGLWKNPPG